MKILCTLSLTILGATLAVAAPVLRPWTPIFKGIDYATGTNPASLAGIQAVYAVRVDLTDPDVRLFTSPALTNSYLMGSRETPAMNPREMLEIYGLKVAVNCAHFTGNGAYDVAFGVAENVQGMWIAQGRLVSAQDTSSDALSTMLFTTNKTATFIPFHNPPGTSATNGIYHAVTGMYPLLTNGVRVYNPSDVSSIPHDSGEPRTAMGLSLDRRYLYIIVIDGRQAGYSNGSADYETADWLLLCGARDGMNCDGGGSSAMVMANTCADGLELNHNSAQMAQGVPGLERRVGGSLGVYAKALPLTFIYEPSIVPGRSIASLSWLTPSPATTQVEYGRTQSLGTFTTVDSNPRTDHTVVLTNLLPNTSNYFRLISTTSGSSNSTPVCSFTTLPYNPFLTNVPTSSATLFEITNKWRYTSNSMDFTAGGWTTNGYVDSGWSGPGPGSFYVEDLASVPYRNTPLPTPCDSTGIPCLDGGVPIAYYYRTHFTFPETPSGTTLTFSNYVDDGAVYYLNGVEIYRLHMPAAPTAITSATYANSYSTFSCGSDACEAQVFALAGSIVNTNLRQGDNVLAAESHNYRASPTSGVGNDQVFGCALQYTKQPAATTNLLLVLSDEPATGVPITVSPGDAYGATTNVTPAEFYYIPSATATLTAPAVMGLNSLLKWQVDGTDFSTNTSITLNMTANRVVRVVYGTVTPYTLTVAASNAVGAVTVKVSPTDLDGQGNGATTFQRSYPQGTAITLVAPTNSGLNTFVKWQTNGVDMTTNPSVSITLTTNQQATAVYLVVNLATLSIASSNVVGGVLVAVSPTDQNGQGSGTTPFQRAYLLNRQVSLTVPTLVGTNQFYKWQVDGVDYSTNAAITLLADSNHLVSAVYGVRTRLLSLTSTNPSVGARLSTQPADLNGQSGIGTTPLLRIFPIGTLVTNNVAVLTSAGTGFQQWLSNGVFYTTKPNMTVLVDNDLTLTAVFTNVAPVPAPLTINQFGTNVVLSWTNPAFSLQYATNLAQPIYWTNVPGIATNSPYTNPTIGPRRFFQLQY